MSRAGGGEEEPELTRKSSIRFNVFQNILLYAGAPIIVSASCLLWRTHDGRGERERNEKFFFVFSFRVRERRKNNKKMFSCLCSSEAPTRPHDITSRAMLSKNLHTNVRATTTERRRNEDYIKSEDNNTLMKSKIPPSFWRPGRFNDFVLKNE